ncbi:MAG: sarcosine oxidase subunit delta [Rhodomicrobium sp.]|nr:sarcosine oxidase subunit delta [Rhodomicrobium sp.]
MRIPCPHCGERSNAEFIAHGPSGLVRPEGSGALGDWIDYAYFRTNPAGEHRELFYHAHGCRAWLTVIRDTRTHAIIGAESACPPRVSK